MDRIARMCEEIHAFAGSAERTGTMMELRGLKTVGHWPKGETAISLDNVKWMGIARAVVAEKIAKRK